MKPASEYLVSGVPTATAMAFGPHALGLRFAGVLFAFTGLSDEQRAVVVARFARLVEPLGDPAAAACLPGAHVRPAASAAFHPTPTTCWEYDLALDYQPAHLDVAGPSFFARMERSACRAEVRTCLQDGFFLGVFENLFRVVSAYALAQRDTLVLHSAGVAQAGQGYVLFGRSGAGKTTSCRLLAGRAPRPGEPPHVILSDELNAVALRSRKEGVVLQPMPFAGDFGHDTLGSEPVPLRRVYALVQASVATVAPCRPAEALARLVAACPFLNADPFESDSVFGRAERLLDAVPLRKLHFPNDPSFWSAVEADIESHAAA